MAGEPEECVIHFQHMKDLHLNVFSGALHNSCANKELLHIPIDTAVFSSLQPHIFKLLMFFKRPSSAYSRGRAVSRRRENREILVFSPAMTEH